MSYQFSALRNRHWLLGVILFAGCSDVQNSTEPDAESGEIETGIVGRIEPPQAAIGIIALRDGIGQTVALTNERGEYRLTELLPGGYTLIVSGSGFFTDTSVRNLIVIAGKVTEAPLVRLRPLGSSAILRGQVVDAMNQRPLPAVEVIIKCSTGICSNLTANTDESGRFEVKIWPDLAAELTCRKEGYQSQSVRIDRQPPEKVFNIPVVALKASR